MSAAPSASPHDIRRLAQDSLLGGIDELAKDGAAPGALFVSEMQRNAGNKVCSPPAPPSPINLHCCAASARPPPLLCSDTSRYTHALRRLARCRMSTRPRPCSSESWRSTTRSRTRSILTRPWKSRCRTSSRSTAARRSASTRPRWARSTRSVPGRRTASRRTTPSACSRMLAAPG